MRGRCITHCDLLAALPGAGMDEMARGLRIAAAIIEDGKLDALIVRALPIHVLCSI